MTEINAIATMLFTYLLAKAKNDNERFNANEIAGVFAKAFSDKAKDILHAFELRGWSVEDIYLLNRGNPGWRKKPNELFRMYDALLQDGHNVELAKTIFKQQAVLELGDENQLLKRLQLWQDLGFSTPDVFDIIIRSAPAVYAPYQDIMSWRSNQLKHGREAKSYLYCLSRQSAGKRPVVQPMPLIVEPDTASVEKPMEPVTIPDAEPTAIELPTTEIIEQPIEIPQIQADEPTESPVLLAADMEEAPASDRPNASEKALLANFMADALDVKQPKRIAHVTRVKPAYPPPPTPIKIVKAVPLDIPSVIRMFLERFDPRFTDERWQKYIETNYWFGILRDPKAVTMRVLVELVQPPSQMVASDNRCLLLASLFLGRDLIMAKSRAVKTRRIDQMTAENIEHLLRTAVRETVGSPAKPSGKKLRRLLKLPAEILAFRYHVLKQYVICNPLEHPQCLTYAWEDVRCERPLSSHTHVFDCPPPGIKNLDAFSEQIIEIKLRVASLQLRGVKEWWLPEIIELLATPSALEFKQVIGPNPQRQSSIKMIDANEARWQRDRITRPKDF